LAKKIATAGETEAVKNNLAVVIAIVDDGGNLVYIEKMDNAQLGSIEIAIKKARTAIYFKRPTKSYEERIAGGTNAILGLPEVLPFEGGLPIVVDGQFIGGIGVSGGTPQQDGIIAKTALEVLVPK
jgi:glc operon protein GlcG